MILHAISGLSNRMSELSGMSASQSVALSALSERSRAETGQPATRNNPYQNSEASTQTFDSPVEKLVSGIGDDTDHQNTTEDLSESIERLCQLAEEKPRTVHSVEAQSIIDDLETLLDAVLMTDSTLNARAQKITNRKMPYDVIGYSGQQAECRRDLKRVRGLLTSSTAIEVNRTGLSCITSVYNHTELCNAGYQRSTNSNTKSVQQRRSRRQLQTSRGTLLVSTLERQFTILANKENSRESLELLGNCKFTAQVQFKPSQPGQNAMILASFNQQTSSDGFLSLTPSLSFSMMLPNNSPVFQLIEEGNLDGLIDMFSHGEASLRDRDEAGIPLLHVSTL